MTKRKRYDPVCSNMVVVEARHVVVGDRMGTLYGDLLATGADTDSHESDLYIEDTPAVRDVLARYPGTCYTSFRHQGNGRRYFDLPFMYVPWWEARSAKAGR